jgi:hypothetical protein
MSTFDDYDVEREAKRRRAAAAATAVAAPAGRRGGAIDSSSKGACEGSGSDGGESNGGDGACLAAPFPGMCFGQQGCPDGLARSRIAVHHCLGLG